MEWADDNPYFLVMVALDRNPDGSLDTLTLDLGERGWESSRSDWLHRAAEWYLCEKQPPQRAVLAQIVHRGEHPYCIKRHVGQMRLNGGQSRSIVVHGIGKRVPRVKDDTGKTVTPERTDRLWLLPGGVVCGGEDVEKLAMAIVASLEWMDVPPEAADGAEAVVDSA